MKKIILVLLVMILCGCSISNIEIKDNDNVAIKDEKVDTAKIKAEILSNFEQINLNNNLLSSDPFDYIENEYYDNIVALGTDAIDVLKQMFEDGEIKGLDAYIATIAISEILDCEIKDGYETAEEFFKLFDEGKCIKITKN